MAGNVIQFPTNRGDDKHSSVTIEKVLAEFCEEHSGSDKAKQECERSVELFMNFLNDYAYMGLDEKNRQKLERHENARGPKHKTFCQLFGPEQIPRNLDDFLHDFLISKVLCSQALLQSTAKMTERLCLWLQQKSYLDAKEIKDAVLLAKKAAIQLPRAEKAAQLIWRESESKYGQVEPDEVGHMRIERIEPGKLWLRPYEGKYLGPVVVSEEISELLGVGWEINCGLKKKGKTWLLIEAINIYPR